MGRCERGLAGFEAHDGEVVPTVRIRLLFVAGAFDGFFGLREHAHFVVSEADVHAVGRLIGVQGAGFLEFGEAIGVAAILHESNPDLEMKLSLGRIARRA